MSSKHLFAVAAIALLSACQTQPLPQAGSMDAGWGEASKYNAAVQTINPEPVYTAESAQPGDNGEKMAGAVKRYRTDAVKPIEPARTTGGQSGGSGGGSGPR